MIARPSDPDAAVLSRKRIQMFELHVVLARYRTLIIEDEPLIAMEVEEEVRKMGCADVLVAYNRQDAIEAVHSFKPDLAILDLGLGDDGDDYEVADLLAERGTPFVFSSGHLAGGLPDRHVGRPFVGKPMQHQHLACAVASALGSGASVKASCSVHQGERLSNFVRANGEQNRQDSIPRTG